MVRTLQCVASFGVVLIVASTIAVSFSGAICLGRPLRCRSSITPASPSLSYRRLHNKTVGNEVDRSRARTLEGLHRAFGRFTTRRVASETASYRASDARSEERRLGE